MIDRFAALAVVVPCVACGADLTWRSLDIRDDAGRSYPARLASPDPTARTGVSVLLLGGGLAFDEHWTVPGSYTIEGKETAVTIDGQPTRDADRIADALVSAGFTVTQWSSIHRDDARARENPALAEGLPFPKTRDLAAIALRTLRAQPEVDPRRVVLIGHSLGAARACQIADDGVIGFVFLAGAYLGGLGPAPSRIVAETVRTLGLGDDPRAVALSAQQFDALRAEPDRSVLLPLSFDLADRDRDGVLRAWELAAVLQRAHDGKSEPGWRADKDQLSGAAWPGRVLLDRRVPTLAIYGGLDPISVNGPILESDAAARGDAAWLRVVYIPDLGHQLSPERAGLVGPMSDDVIAMIRRWLVERFARSDPR